MIRALIMALAAVTLAPPAQSIQITAKARSLQPGEVVVLSIVPARAEEAIRVRAFDRDVPAYQSSGGWQAIVGIDLDVKPGTYAVTVETGAGKSLTRATYDLKIATRVFRTRRLTVNEAFVTPPKSELPRIEKEAVLLAATWRASASARLWSAPFIRPVTEAANSAFGTRSVFNGKPRNAHGGADFLSPAGTPIHSPNAGRIAVARNLYYSGNTVIIDHGLGVFSTLAHLSRIDVREGDSVTPNQLIGLVGATGRVTGPHLHWAVRVGDARVDPLSLLDTLGE
ncbi:MAG: peptidoglycan DD-metalloendopeptidase family protein [Acidobacteriota bacterium]